MKPSSKPISFHKYNGGCGKNTMRIYDLCDVACVHLETTCNPLKAVVPSVFDSFMMLKLNGSM